MINTNYGEVQAAYGALVNISRQNLQIRLAAALKWKRILGVLRPLVAQADEQRDELIERFAQKDEDGKPLRGDQPDTIRLADTEGFSAAMREMAETALQVGSDKVKLADFGDPDALVGSNLVALLFELGPFFENEPESEPEGA